MIAAASLSHGPPRIKKPTRLSLSFSLPSPVLEKFTRDFSKKRKRNSTAHLLSEEKRNPFPRIRNGNDFSFSCNYIIKNAWKFPPSIRSHHIERSSRDEGRRGSMNRISIGRERSTRCPSQRTSHVKFYSGRSREPRRAFTSFPPRICLLADPSTSRARRNRSLSLSLFEMERFLKKRSYICLSNVRNGRMTRRG